MRALCVASLLLVAQAASAQDAALPDENPYDAPIEAPPPAPAPPPTLAEYLDALASRRLLAIETGSLETMRATLAEGEQLVLAERYEEAALVLYELLESPRFADFEGSDEQRAAAFTLATALEELGAYRTASHYLEEVLAGGPEGSPYFAPAYRRFVDVALRSGDLERAITALEALALESVPEDSQNELRYLRGRARYDRNDEVGAESLLAEVTRRSRFYANAQYLRGAIAVRAGNLQLAEDHFCRVTSTGDDDRFTFYVDDRYFEVKDLAQLALGRVAHEGRRADDAFYYYFQVPNDSARVSAALFESAFAMYEGGDLETAIDLLDQLEARFPESPFVDEARLLRGYVHLGRCEFDEANALFTRFARTFTPLVAEVHRILENPARRAALEDELLRGERSTLLALLEVSPTFYRLHADVRTLDAEAARAGRLSADLAAIAARVRGGDAPRAAAEIVVEEDDAMALGAELADARAQIAGLSSQLDAMRQSGARPAALDPIEASLRAQATRIATLEGRLTEANSAFAGRGEGAPQGEGIDALLERDRAHAARFPSRVASLRARLVSTANDAAVRALEQLARRLESGLRRARIGRIDAVMGSKRRIEIQIESLAAGRFPPELQDPLRIQGLLRDDEEYWPFEGEHWTDEFGEAVDLEALEEDE